MSRSSHVMHLLRFNCVLFRRLKFHLAQSQQLTNFFSRLADWHVRLHKLDRIVVFPSELIMMYRMATLLRGLSLALQYNIGVAEHWHGAAQQLLDAV